MVHFSIWFLWCRSWTWLSSADITSNLFYNTFNNIYAQRDPKKTRLFFFFFLIFVWFFHSIGAWILNDFHILNAMMVKLLWWWWRLNNIEASKMCCIIFILLWMMMTRIFFNLFFLSRNLYFMLWQVKLL